MFLDLQNNINKFTEENTNLEKKLLKEEDTFYNRN